MGRLYWKRFCLLLTLVAVTYLVLRALSQYHRQRLQFFALKDDSEIDIRWTPVVNVPLQDAVEKETVQAMKRTVHVPSERLVQSSLCPICFGTDVCQYIANGELELDTTKVILSHEKPVKLSYEGKWHKGEHILAKTLLPSEFAKLDRRLCQSRGLRWDCNVTQAAVKSPLFRNLVTPGSTDSSVWLNIDVVRKIVQSLNGKTGKDVPLLLCTNDKLLTLLSTIYDEDDNGHLSNTEAIMLISALALQSEAVLLRLLTKVNPGLSYLQYYGTCGRIMVVEGGVAPLRQFTQESFAVRASLAVQLLQLIDDFLFDEDSDFLILFTGFTIDNLAVNKDGEVVIIDIEDMMLVDKTAVKPSPGVIDDATTLTQPCNEPCFEAFTKRLLRQSDNGETCSRVSKYGHLMYEVVCQQVLSSLKEHRYSDTGRSRQDYPGLLHSPPMQDATLISDLLQECVHETGAGGRIQAAQELREQLSQIARKADPQTEEEEEEDDDNEDVKADTVEVGIGRRNHGQYPEST